MPKEYVKGEWVAPNEERSPPKTRHLRQVRGLEEPVFLLGGQREPLGEEVISIYIYPEVPPPPKNPWSLGLPDGGRLEWVDREGQSLTQGAYHYRGRLPSRSHIAYVNGSRGMPLLNKHVPASLYALIREAFEAKDELRDLKEGLKIDGLDLGTGTVS